MIYMANGTMVTNTLTKAARPEVVYEVTVCTAVCNSAVAHFTKSNIYTLVNMTETYTALSMITKAGVSSNKIAVGVSSYGRSFQMTDSSCTGMTTT